MAEEHWPLADLLELRAGDGPEGAPAVTFSERRPRVLCEIAGWNGTHDVLAMRLGEACRVPALPEPGCAVASADVTLLRTGPRRYVAISASAGLGERLAAAVTADTGAVVDLSHARTGLRIAGPAAEAALQKGLDIDLDIRAFPPMSVANSAIHHVHATVLRVDAEIFDVFVFRGFAASFLAWSSEAAREFGWTAGPPIA